MNHLILRIYSEKCRDMFVGKCTKIFIAADFMSWKINDCLNVQKLRMS